MAIRIISILTYLIVCILVSFSAIASEVDAEFERITNICIHPEGGIPFDVAACYEKYDIEIGRELQKVYDRLRDILGSGDGMLREAQRAWLKFQQLNCAFVEDFYKEESRGWAAVNRSQCKLRTTLERKFELEDYLGFLREQPTERQKYENCLDLNIDQSLKQRQDYCARNFPLGASNK